MNDSKKALLIFGGFAAAVVIVVGVMMSKTAFWLVGLLALLGVIIAAAVASDGSQKSDAPLREDEILDPDERFGFAFAVWKAIGIHFTGVHELSHGFVTFGELDGLVNDVGHCIHYRCSVGRYGRCFAATASATEFDYSYQ